MPAAGPIPGRLPDPSRRRVVVGALASGPWPQARTVRTPPRRALRAGAWGLQLALYLLLAGFFAVLLGRSGAEPGATERVLRALAGLGSGIATARVRALPGDGEVGSVAGEGAPVAGSEPLSAAEREAGLMARVRLAEERLFTADGAVRRWRLFLLARLARRAAQPELRLEVLAPVGELKEDATARKLSALIATLRRLGASERALAVGIGATGERLWTLRLRQLPREGER